MVKVIFGRVASKEKRTKTVMNVASGMIAFYLARCCIVGGKVSFS